MVFLNLFNVNPMFFEWKNNLTFYVLLVLSLIILYIATFYVIQFAVSLKLTQTLTYIFTLLLLVVGAYVYTDVVGGIHIKRLLQLTFESIIIFGGLLFLFMLFRSILRKIRT